MIWMEFYAFVLFKKKTLSGHLNNDPSGKGLRRRAAHGQQLRWTRGTKRKQPLGLASVDWTDALERPGPNSSGGSSKGLFLETPIFQRDLFITPPAKYNRSGRGSELQGRVVTICSRGSQQVGEALPSRPCAHSQSVILVLVCVTFLPVIFWHFLTVKYCIVIMEMLAHGLKNKRLFGNTEQCSCLGLLAGVLH